MSDKPKNLDDIDRFWDLNTLLPKKRLVSPAYSAPNTDTVEINIDSPAQRDNDVAIPPRADVQKYRSHALEPYLIYTPENSLIRRVEVSKWSNKFNFYENFRMDAVRLWSRAATECEHVPFFAYVPQYSQLKYAQLKWYLWWRENVRGGVYLRTDFCYILIYIYEILNCPNLIEPERGIELLCDIWLAYRAQHPRIDSYMCDWLCDYALINKLPCPTHRLEPILGEIVAKANFKEFYISGANTSAAAEMLSHTSTYDFRKSRYVTAENISVFAAHIRAAFDRVWHEVISKNSTDSAKLLRVERVSYEGALCVYDMKRTVAVEYASYTRSPRFRFVATDIIKYSENRVRMALGIKSRLKVEELTDEMRACIDRYFDENLPAQKKVRAPKYGESENIVPEYEKHYEPISSTLSVENAMQIEKASWGTAELLSAAFEEEKADASLEAIAPTKPKLLTAAENSGQDEFSVLVGMLDSTALDALTLLANGDADGVAKSAKGVGMLADALADKINECAFDIIGDSIIEPDGTGYRIIADYEGDIKKWLK